MTQSADQTLPAPRDPRYISLDIWRGVACLMVVVFHSTQYPGTYGAFSAGDPWSYVVEATQRFWIGVPVFFVISGYCISATADSTRRRSTGRLRNYFWRRFRRIFPPYWAALAFGTILIFAVDQLVARQYMEAVVPPLHSLTSLTPRQLLGNVTLTETWFWRLDPPKYVFIDQAWTLCYEEQFYAVVGLLIWLAPRRYFLNVLLLSLLTVPLIGNPAVRGFFFDGYWLMFAAGVLVYHAINYQSRPQRWASAGLLLACGLYAMWPIRDLLPHKGNDLKQSFFVVSAFSLALLATKGADAAVAGHWAMRPLVWSGARCYSLYLVHFPLVRIISFALYRAGYSSDFLTCTVTIPLCMAVSLLVGEVFFRLVERRFLNAPQPSSSVRKP